MVSRFLLDGNSIILVIVDMKEFTLDFSGKSGVPSQWGINVQQVVKWFHQQIGDMDGVQLVSDRRRGVFNIMALTQQAETLLSSFELKAEKAKPSFFR